MIKVLKLMLGTLAVILIIPAGASHAASTALSSFGKTLEKYEDEERQEKLLKKAVKLLVDKNLDEEYEKAYAAKKWKKEFTSSELRDMACIMYAEAKDQSFESLVAVGNTIINRMHDTKDWDHVSTVHEVIFDKKWATQFAPTKDGSLNRAYKIYDNLTSDEYSSYTIDLMNKCIDAAKAVFKGYKTVPDDFMFFNSHIPAQSKKCMEKGWGFSVINGHIYYAEKKYVEE